MQIKTFFNSTWLIIYAFLFGILTAYKLTPLVIVAKAASNVFVNLLQLISLPLIFLSIVATISGMQGFDEIKLLGRKVLKYTLSTTLIAATIALILFKIINPVGSYAKVAFASSGKIGSATAYFSFLAKIIPSNFIEAFGDNSNVASVVFLAFAISLAILSLPHEKKDLLHNFFDSLFAAILKITHLIIFIIPVGVWAFVTIFIQDLNEGIADIDFKKLMLYIIVVLLANAIQGFIVLPLLLKMKGISPLKTFKGMSQALMVAFFSKSSTTALPLTLKCAEKNLKISKRVANFTIPICATINMNGCAAFILTTVLFVSMSNGMIFSGFDLIMWIFIATLAAVGNAGVPMGCYFLATAFLAAMDVPLYIMGVILPFHALLDMPETALNVWSDSCVAAVVDKELKK